MANDALLRTVRLAPYRKGYGPTFTLRLWDTYRTDSMGKCRIRYELRQHESGKSSVLFAGEDFSCSPLHAIDSDSCVASLLGFLTLRPGDTDAEYFENYTSEQMAYAEAHAETLSCEAMDRFGDC